MSLNPAVLRKELRTLLRERRGWLVPVVYAAVLSAAAYLFTAAWSGQANDLEARETIGQTLAGLVAVMQTIAITIMAPLVGAAAIAGEREHGSWTRLLASPASRTSIGVGKVLSASLYVLVLCTVSLPIAGLALLFGGADGATIAGLYLTHAILAIAMVALGLFVSTLFQRTWTAALTSITIAMGLAVFTLAIYVAMRLPRLGETDTTTSKLVLYLNPYYGLYLFFGGDSGRADRSEWALHYAAMLGLAALAIGGTLARLRNARD